MPGKRRELIDRFATDDGHTESVREDCGSVSHRTVAPVPFEVAWMVRTTLKVHALPA